MTSWIVLFISTKEVGALIETDRLPVSDVRTGSNSDRVAVDLSEVANLVCVVSDFDAVEREILARFEIAFAAGHIKAQGQKENS